MRAEVINAFIKAGIDVISQMAGIEPQLGKAYRKDTPYKSDNIVVLIGITGALHGSVAVSLSKELACDIASKMMGGVPVPALDEMAKSAVAELCNMIMGNAGILLSEFGVTIDLTPPTTLTGDNLEFSIQDSVIFCIPLLFENNESLELNISYQEQ